MVVCVEGVISDGLIVTYCIDKFGEYIRHETDFTHQTHKSKKIAMGAYLHEFDMIALTSYLLDEVCMCEHTISSLLVYIKSCVLLIFIWEFLIQHIDKS